MLHQKLAQSKDIVNLIDVFEDDIGIYQVTKYYPTLGEYFNEGSKLPRDFVLTILKDIAQILLALHSENIAHRKLTLDSVYIKVKNNRFKILIGGLEFAIILKKGYQIVQ